VDFSYKVAGTIEDNDVPIVIGFPWPTLADLKMAAMEYFSQKRHHGYSDAVSSQILMLSR
jgi:hypothetical protein